MKKVQSLTLKLNVSSENVSSELDLESFWDKQAGAINWFKKWTKVLDWKEPVAKWFVGGELNASHLCLDVHIKEGRSDKIAIYWEDENGNKKTYTYGQLHKEVNNFSASLKKLGVKKGDVVVLYLPMITQAIVSMLSVARLGAIHTVVFSGFSSMALRDRIAETKSKFIITADYGLRRGKKIPLKKIVDEAVKDISLVEKIILVNRSDENIYSEETFNVNVSSDNVMEEGRDILYRDLIKNSEDFIDPVPVESNHPLYILYTSGTTGKPKGIVHSTGGYLVYIYNTFKRCFGINRNDVYWCAADIGWVTGHSYIVYAPLMHGASIFLYEGAPDTPSPSRWWELIEKYKVSIFYTSPTALRMFRSFGDKYITKSDLSSLRILGSVGEVINPEIWKWYSSVIGNNKCLIIDTWWQTETGGFMIAPRSNFKITDLKPGSVSFPLPGISADIVDESGNTLPAGEKGFLVINKPWPGMALGIYGDAKRYKDVYWTKFKGMYYSGDYAVKDSDGYFWILGRSDETLNIASHRIGTSELESVIVESNSVAEAAVVGIPDSIKGENFIVFVVLKNSKTLTLNVSSENVSSDFNLEEVKKEIILGLRKSIGSLSKPKDIFFVKSLPKTRSGKILRRLLKKIFLNESYGDLSTLENNMVVKDIQKQLEITV